MRTDTDVHVNGLRALAAALGAVEAERFITLMSPNHSTTRDGSDIPGQARVWTKLVGPP